MDGPLQPGGDACRIDGANWPAETAKSLFAAASSDDCESDLLSSSDPAYNAVVWTAPTSDEDEGVCSRYSIATVEAASGAELAPPAWCCEVGANCRLIIAKGDCPSWSSTPNFQRCEPSIRQVKTLGTWNVGMDGVLEVLPPVPMSQLANGTAEACGQRLIDTMAVSDDANGATFDPDAATCTLYKLAPVAQQSTEVAEVGTFVGYPMIEPCCDFEPVPEDKYQQAAGCPTTFVSQLNGDFDMWTRFPVGTFCSDYVEYETQCAAGDAFEVVLFQKGNCGKDCMLETQPIELRRQQSADACAKACVAFPACACTYFRRRDGLCAFKKSACDAQGEGELAMDYDDLQRNHGVRICEPLLTQKLEEAKQLGAEDSGSSGGVHVAAIVVPIVAVVCLVCLVAGLLLWRHKRSNRKSNMDEYGFPAVDMWLRNDDDEATVSGSGGERGPAATLNFAEGPVPQTIGRNAADMSPRAVLITDPTRLRELEGDDVKGTIDNTVVDYRAHEDLDHALAGSQVALDSITMQQQESNNQDGPSDAFRVPVEAVGKAGVGGAQLGFGEQSLSSTPDDERIEARPEGPASTKELADKRADRVRIVTAQRRLLISQMIWIQQRRGRPFLDRFRLLDVENRSGGQGLVFFAQNVRTKQHVVLKFYTSSAAFSVEAAACDTSALRACMPAVVAIIQSSEARSTGDMPKPLCTAPLPPFIITERGLSLTDYLKRSWPDFVSAMQIVVQVTKRVELVHKAGWVHQDLKPANVIWLDSENSWWLIDFGCAGHAGSVCPIAFSVAYAAPEQLAAVRDGARTFCVAPATDVWALGVMFYELLTQTRYYSQSENAADIMHVDPATLPHIQDREGSGEKYNKLRFMRDIIMRMLSVDPAERPTVSEVRELIEEKLDK